MSKTLDTLFQSKARVKLLKFLYRNGNNGGFTLKEIASRIQERPSAVSREIKNLVKIGAVIKKSND